MQINYDGESMECGPDNTIIVHYRNDILNGAYVDVSEDNYAFITEHDQPWDAVEQALIDDGVGYWDEEDCIPEGEINYGEAPHLYIMNSVARLIVAEATQICKDNA